MTPADYFWLSLEKTFSATYGTFCQVGHIYVSWKTFVSPVRMHLSTPGSKEKTFVGVFAAGNEVVQHDINVGNSVNFR